MYYYILEQQKNKNSESLVNKIIASIEDLQIMGEAVKANPIQKPDELAEIGLSKGYNTVVAVGSDSIINEIAPIVAKHSAVLGIIPTDPNSSFFNLIDCSTWNQAISILAKRITNEFDLGVLGKEKVFLSHLSVRPKKNNAASVKVIFDKYEVEAPIEEVIVGNSYYKDEKWAKYGFSDNLVSIYLKSKEAQKNSGFFKNLFSAPKTSFTSVFHAHTCHLGGLEKTLSVFSSDNQFICHTPIHVSVIPKAIKLIVGKK